MQEIKSIITSAPVRDTKSESYWELRAKFGSVFKQQGICVAENIVVNFVSFQKFISLKGSTIKILLTRDYTGQTGLFWRCVVSMTLHSKNLHS